MKRGINNITIIGRRWFDRINGNTYHSTVVYVNEELIGEVSFTYGYGDQYIQTGFEILRDAGFYSKSKEHTSSGFPKAYGQFLDDIRKHRNKFVISVADVRRKRDL